MRGRDADGAALTRALLLCGTAVCPIFYVVVVAQMATRPGFDMLRHPLSLLALGEMGWVQVANFELAGMLGLACATGLARIRSAATASIWQAALIASFGIDLMIAGVFPSDALLGFPPGAMPGIPTHISTHAKLHGLGFFIAFGSLIAACFVVARAYRIEGRAGWRRWSIAVGIVTPMLIAGGMGIQRLTSTAFFVAGLIGFSWLGAMALDRARSS